MTDNFEKNVAVDGPVVNAGELGSSTFSPGQALSAGPLGLGQRWTVARKREVVLRLLRDEPDRTAQVGKSSMNVANTTERNA